MTSFTPKFVILAILDGWGMAPPRNGNAITLAATPNVSKFWISYPHTWLDASGEAVGLPREEDGNTETGHLNLGAGRIVYQDLERINRSIAEGSFFDNKVFLEAIAHVKKNKSGLHIMGLIGAGGVHSNINHLFALIHMAASKSVQDLFLHLFTDGRDSPPTGAKTYVKSVEEVIKKERVGRIASVMGRYWALDRDYRWDRTKKAYEALTLGRAQLVKTPEEAIEISYGEGKTDEFIEPSIITNSGGVPVGLVKDGDAVIFFNFRVDRPRQLTKAFVLKDFSKAGEEREADLHHIGDHVGNRQVTKTTSQTPFKREVKLQNLLLVTMTEYSKALVEEGAKPAFPPEVVEMPIGRAVSSEGLRQLRITESEKERFVTFYFDGLRDKPFPLEERIIIPSSTVPTYDKKPEMSARHITDTLISKVLTLDYQFVVVNFPNADMVGHTGNIEPTVKAVEVVDECIGKIASVALAHEGALIITADHGNAEEMVNLITGEVDTEHSTNPVPFIAVSSMFTGRSQTLSSGILADVAPTILNLLGLPIPTTMTGRDLLKEVMQG